MTLSDISQSDIVQQIRDGKVGVIPTDTIYGVVCSAANPESVKRLYELKKRVKKPGTVIAANVDQLVKLGVKARYLKAVEQYWPNPISIELPLGDALPYLQQGTGVCAFRIPSDSSITALLEETGPLLTSSANEPGEPPATDLEEARAYFGDKVDFYVNGGDMSGRPASTVIRIVDDALVVIRQGAVAIGDDGAIVARHP